MRFVEMSRGQFSDFRNKFQDANVYQMAEYGELMAKQGYNYFFVGVIDELKEIVAAALVLYKVLPTNTKYAYIPGGMLVDYDDNELLKFFTRSLKVYFKKRNVAYFKIDPMVPVNIRDIYGNATGGANTGLVDYLKSLGYQHFGYNSYFENLKPRFNAVLETTAPSDEIYNRFSDDLKTKLVRAKEQNVAVYKGTPEHVKGFYQMIKHKIPNRDIHYYENYFDIYSKNNLMELYFAKIDTEGALTLAKHNYEKEGVYNAKLANDLQIPNLGNRDEMLSAKMESDKRLDNYHKDVVAATKLLQNYPTGLITSTAAIIKNNNEIFFLIDASLDDYRSYYGKELIYWTVIKEYADLKYNKFNLNAVSGNFEPTDKYARLINFKGGFGTVIYEYPGEFDFVVNLGQYNFLNKLPSFNLFGRGNESKK